MLLHRVLDQSEDISEGYFSLTTVRGDVCFRPSTRSRAAIRWGVMARKGVVELQVQKISGDRIAMQQDSYPVTYRRQHQLKFNCKRVTEAAGKR